MTNRLEQVTAAILAGGQGTRLRAVVADRQKVVAPVAGRPFLYRLLDQLADAGISKVVLCTGFQARQVEEMLGNTYRDMRLHYSVEAEPLGTAGALRQALPALDTEPVLVLNGDSFCETNLPAMLSAHRGPATIVVREVPDTTQSGRVEFDADGVVTSFIEKGAVAGPGWLSGGIYLLGREVLSAIPTGRAVSIEKEAFPAWVGRGLRAFPTRGRFLDIGTPETYSVAQQFFR
jgi:NDP-sugar pyrophosphorylase family protein